MEQARYLTLEPKPIPNSAVQFVWDCPGAGVPFECGWKETAGSRLWGDVFIRFISLKNFLRLLTPTYRLTIIFLVGILS